MYKTDSVISRTNKLDVELLMILIYWLKDIVGWKADLSNDSNNAYLFENVPTLEFSLTYYHYQRDPLLHIWYELDWGILNKNSGAKKINCVFEINIMVTMWQLPSNWMFIYQGKC